VRLTRFGILIDSSIFASKSNFKFLLVIFSGNRQCTDIRFLIILYVASVTLPTEGRVNVNQMVISITADVISQRHLLILEVPIY